MENAAWDLRHQALHGTYEHAEVLFAWLLTLGGDVTGCTEALLAFPKYDQIALERFAELTDRGVDVLGLRQSAADARARRSGAASRTIFDMVADVLDSSDHDRH